MKAEIRQHKILNLINREMGVSVRDLAEFFHVSRMTIHRDLTALAKQGHLLRIHGGAVLKRTSALPSCPVCKRMVLAHQQTEIVSPQDLKTTTCCTTCGLDTYLKRSPQYTLWVHDLLTGQRLAAELAFYLLNSAATACCQPSVISFARQDQLTLFQTGFGGTGARFTEALDFLRVNQRLASNDKAET